MAKTDWQMGDTVRFDRTYEELKRSRHRVLQPPMGVLIVPMRN